MHAYSLSLSVTRPKHLLAPPAHTHQPPLHILTWPSCTYSSAPPAHTHLALLHILTWPPCTYSPGIINQCMVSTVSQLRPSSSTLNFLRNALLWGVGEVLESTFEGGVASSSRFREACRLKFCICEVRTG